MVARGKLPGWVRKAMMTAEMMPEMGKNNLIFLSLRKAISRIRVSATVETRCRLAGSTPVFKDGIK